jgi:hypothetical protein
VVSGTVILIRANFCLGTMLILGLVLGRLFNVKACAYAEQLNQKVKPWMHFFI